MRTVSNDVVELRDAEALGGKAGALARLIAAGLPVPPGVVLRPEAFARVVGGAGEEIALAQVGVRIDAIAHAIETAEVAGELVAAVRRLGGVVVVRSSVSIEDQAGGSAAGVFASRVAVREAEIPDAVRAVWTSALTPLAIAYARRAGASGVRVAVIVQRHVPGRRATLYTRPPGRAEADEVWIERQGEAVVKVGRDDERAGIAIAAERAIGAERGADVELVEGDDGATWVVQARPIVHPVRAPARVAAPGVLFVFSTQTPGVTWRRDVAHNPDPLSPAQAGLVESVVRTGASPWDMRVVAGYLYVADAAADPDAAPIGDVGELIARYRELATRMEGALDAGPRVADAVAAYLGFFRIYAGELTPMLARARKTLVEEVGAARAARLVARRPGSIEAAIVAAAKGEIDEPALLRVIGDQAAAWDVAVPTHAERPELVRAAVERVRAALGELRPIEIEPAPPEIAARVAIARAAAGLAEEDDRLFARAQAQVRRALLATGRAIGLDNPEDACWLPLDEVIGIEAGDPVDPLAARVRAAGARAAADRARRWTMPLAVRDGIALGPATQESAPPTDDWRGAGSGAAVTGVVHRVDALVDAALVAPGTIAVVPAVTPALAVLLAGARALVSATGGILDHGAAIARELGIPCVVGVPAAFEALGDGELVLVDGDAGLVRRLG